MNVLCVCEESQAVCIAFRKLGHIAFSCDIQDCSGGHPEWHIKGDCIPLINGWCSFTTCDGVNHYINGTWDLLICFPPCTYLTKVSARHLFCNGVLQADRYKLLLDAREFFMTLYNADCKHICIENPTPLKIANLPAYSQVIQPYQFGHPYSKRTCLWLKDLPYLLYTDIVPLERPWVSSSNNGVAHSPKMRSKTFSGIAAAMAEQWSFL